MGMIFLNNEDLPIESIVKKYVSPEMQPFMDKFYKCLEIAFNYE
jgi:hypothetical protein